MKKIVNDPLLKSYINKYNIEDFFETTMSPYMSLYHFEKGEMVCEIAQEMQMFYFLVSGKLSVYDVLFDNGNPLLLRFNKPLSILGDLEFLNKKTVKCNVEALTSATLIGIRFEDLYTHAYSDAKFLRFIIKNLSLKLSSNTAANNLLIPVENRIASYLLASNLHENSHPLLNEVKITKITELAALLGTSYRHLNRIMNKFILEGIIQKEKGLIRIINSEKLTVLAKSNLYE